MKELGRKLGEMEYDGLITDLTPKPQVRGGTIAKLEASAVLKRGTLLGKGEDGLLTVYGGTGTPDCILCDDTEVGTTEDVRAATYTAGCFDPEKLTVASGYTITEGDKDNLRMRNIVFKTAAPAI